MTQVRFEYSKNKINFYFVFCLYCKMPVSFADIFLRAPQLKTKKKHRHFPDPGILFTFHFHTLGSHHTSAALLGDGYSHPPNRNQFPFLTQETSVKVNIHETYATRHYSLYGFTYPSGISTFLSYISFMCFIRWISYFFGGKDGCI